MTRAEPADVWHFSDADLEQTGDEPMALHVQRRNAHFSPSFHPCFKNKIQLLWLLIKSRPYVAVCVMYSLTFALIRKLISIYGFIYHIGTNDAQQATSAEEDAEHLIHPWVPAPWKVYHGMQLIYLSWFKYSSEGGAVVTDSFPRFLSFHQMKWWTKQRVIIQKTKNIQATILEQLFVYTEKNRRPLFLSLFNRGN